MQKATSQARKAQIIRNFDRHAQSYESYAQHQAFVAQKLADLLPQSLPKRAKILEVGCGTGLLTQHLLNKYPQAQFHITDIAPAMLEKARQRCAGHQAEVHFSQMDAEHLTCDTNYDLIISSLCLHWCENPLSALQNLAARGPAYYSVPGPDNFKQWHELTGTQMPPVSWPAIVAEDHTQQSYSSSKEFLTMLHKTGVMTLPSSAQNLAPQALKQALKAFDAAQDKAVTWHVLYGVMA